MYFYIGHFFFRTYSHISFESIPRIKKMAGQLFNFWETVKVLIPSVSPAKLASSGEHTLGAPQCEKGIVLQHKEHKRKESIPKFKQELRASVLSTSAGQGVKRTTVELCCRYSSLKYLFPTSQRRMTEVRRCCSNRSQSQRWDFKLRRCALWKIRVSFGFCFEWWANSRECGRVQIWRLTGHLARGSYWTHRQERSWQTRRIPKESS